MHRRIEQDGWGAIDVDCPLGKGVVFLEQHPSDTIILAAEVIPALIEALSAFQEAGK